MLPESVAKARDLLSGRARKQLTRLIRNRSKRRLQFVPWSDSSTTRRLSTGKTRRDYRKLQRKSNYRRRWISLQIKCHYIGSVQNKCVSKEGFPTSLSALQSLKRPHMAISHVTAARVPAESNLCASHTKKRGKSPARKDQGIEPLGYDWENWKFLWLKNVGSILSL